MTSVLSPTLMFLLIALCGGLGAVCRFEVDSAVNRCVARRHSRGHSRVHSHRLKFPLGTIVVNVTACFLLGLLTGMVAGWASAASGSVAAVTAATVKLILGTGFLGGYSTFSTASVEGFRQIQAGHYASALLHTGGMLVLSLIAGLLGLAIG